MTERTSYSLYSFAGDVGGLTGLLLGASFWSVFKITSSKGRNIIAKMFGTTKKKKLNNATFKI